MKHTSMTIGLIVGALLFGSAAVAGQPLDSEADDARRLVEDFYRAIEAKDAETVAGMLAEEARLVMPFTFSGATLPDARFEGREQVMGYFGTVFANFAQVRFTEVEINVTGDGRVVFAEAIGDFITAQGEMPYRNVYIIKFELREGKIAAISEYANPVIFAMTFGMPLGTVNQ